MKFRPTSAFLFALLTLCSGVRAAMPKALPDDRLCTEEDRKYIARTYELAASAAEKGNSSYGALLVKDGEVMMEFENDSRTSGDTTHHAETGLISAASVKFGREALVDAILYTSTEPCIMCCGSIRSAGIKQFVYGTTAIQVSRLRGGPLPENPLQCREVFIRSGVADVKIWGPLMEAEGLAVHAEAMAAH